jgi:uncharacterized protein with GYD domain
MARLGNRADVQSQHWPAASLSRGWRSRQAVLENAAQVGGKLEAMYFAFGDVDCYMIVDLPDNVSAAALSFVVNESGAVASKTVVLLTPEEVDAAVKKKLSFRAPGR